MALKPFLSKTRATCTQARVTSAVALTPGQLLRDYQAGGKHSIQREDTGQRDDSHPWGKQSGMSVRFHRASQNTI